MKAVLLVLGVCVVAGCTPATETEASAPAAPAEPAKPTAPMSDTAGPAGQDNMTWIARPTSPPSLRYAPLEGDQYAVKFECVDIGSGQKAVSVWLQRPGLSADQKSFTFTLGSVDQATNIPGGVYGSEIQAQIPTNNFSTIKTSGKVSITDEGKSAIQMDAVDDTERKTISDFFTTCGA